MAFGAHVSPGVAEITAAVQAALGRQPGTVLFTNARIVDVITGEVREGAVLLAGRLIAGVGDAVAASEAHEVRDLRGRWLAPGLIDGHVHIESSLLTPAEYARAVVPRGVTGVVCDPHEIANVSGVEGVRWFLGAGEGLPLDVWIGVPSCVPASPLETSGARLGLTEIAPFLNEPRVIGVAEVMDFPGVLAAQEDVLRKVLLAETARKVPDGHAPLVRGRSLQAYLSAGILSDHETTGAEEGLEKLRAGCFLMVREGSTIKNLDALAGLVHARHADRIGFVTDDRLPNDLLDEGGVDVLVRQAIGRGVDPVLAIRCASWNTVRYFALRRRGAIAPGYLADLVVLDDLEKFHAARVYKEGRLVAEGGRLIADLPAAPAPGGAVRDTVRLPALSPGSFRIPAVSGPVRCIRLVPSQVLTELEWITPLIRAGEIVPDPDKGIAKLVCVERHGLSGHVGTGVVAGFGLRRGALASTVAHDHHNLMAVGTADEDILAACRRLQAIGGGFVVAAGGEIVADLPLPIAGLISDLRVSEVRERLDRLDEAARGLGVRIPSPFMTLSFLGLAVIPELRLTDLGLVDVMAGRLVPLGADD